MSSLSAISSSSYLQQAATTSEASSSSSSQKPQDAGPPPRGGGSRAGAQVKSALAEQGLDKATLKTLKTEIEAALSALAESGETDAEAANEEVLAILEQYGVDTEELAADLSDLAPPEESSAAASVSENYAQSSSRPPRGAAANSLLRALFSIDVEA